MGPTGEGDEPAPRRGRGAARSERRDAVLAVANELLESFRRAMDSAGVHYDDVVLCHVASSYRRRGRPTLYSLVHVESRLGWECYRCGQQRWYTAMHGPLRVVTTDVCDEAGAPLTDSVRTERLDALLAAALHGGETGVALADPDDLERGLERLTRALAERLDANGIAWARPR